MINQPGWKMTGAMDCFTIPVAASPLAVFVRRLPWLKGVYGRYTARVLKRYLLPDLGVVNSVIAGHWGVHRDGRYLAYKTYSPTQVIGIGHVKAWIRINQTLSIGDLSLGEASPDPLLAVLKKIAARLGIRMMYFRASRGTHLHAVFMERFAHMASFPVLFQDFESGIPLDSMKFTFADIDIF